MDAESPAPKEEAIRAVEAEIKSSIFTAWIYLGSAVLLASISIVNYEMHRASNRTGWVQIVVELPVALFMLGVSLMAGRLIVQRRRLLVQLKEMMVQETAGEQPGVWPPPPSGQWK